MSRPNAERQGHKHKYTAKASGSSIRSKRPNPQRGGPGILWTCEQGKEKRCLREGLDILQYYLERQNPVQQPTNSDKLSLDDEIAMLKDQNKRKKSDLPFRVYETGCKGTVFLLFEEEKKEATEEKTKHDRDSDDPSDEPGPKRQRVDKEDASPNGDTNGDTGADIYGNSKSKPVVPSWEPLSTVLDVFDDLQSEVTASTAATNNTDAANQDPSHPSSSIPTSRFVSRMIPIQATCFANIEEIQETVKTLLKQHDATGAKHTFAVQAKRRCCEHLTRQDMIQAVAHTVVSIAKDWTVDLRQPDFTILVETCKTLVGISVLPSSCSKLRNFNLAEIRAKVGVATE